MLKGISPLLSPELLDALYRMGHGDELILADAHFPGENLGPPTVRADGLRIADLLDAILPLIALDQYVAQPLAMMDAVEGDTLDPAVQAGYMAVARRHEANAAPPELVERFAFYERARDAFVIVMTGDTSKYGNLIVKKGVTPVE